MQFEVAQIAGKGLHIARILRMVDEQRAERQIELIGEVVGMASALGIDLWLRGGWAVDFILGEVTRDHVDIDWFAWLRDAEVIRAAALSEGWQPVGSAPIEQQFEVDRDGYEMSFAWLARDDADRVIVAGGPWAGEPWPEEMLDAASGRIGLVSCLVINLAAQIEIKEMMPIWVLGRPRRAKDAQDIVRLREVLRSQGADPG